MDARLSAAVLAVYTRAACVPVDPGMVGSAEALRVQRALDATACSVSVGLGGGAGGEGADRCGEGGGRPMGRGEGGNGCGEGAGGADAAREGRVAQCGEGGGRPMRRGEEEGASDAARGLVAPDAAREG